MYQKPYHFLWSYEKYSHKKKRVFTGLYAFLWETQHTPDSAACRTTFNTNNLNCLTSSVWHIIVEEICPSLFLQCNFTSLRFMCLCTALLRSCQSISVSLASGLWLGHWNTLIHSIFSHYVKDYCCVMLHLHSHLAKGRCSRSLVVCTDTTLQT